MGQMGLIRPRGLIVPIGLIRPISPILLGHDTPKTQGVRPEMRLISAANSRRQLKIARSHNSPKLHPS